ncbi:MAG: fibronectin type III domain-containing protein [Nitrosotalea sp.]
MTILNKIALGIVLILLGISTNMMQVLADGNGITNIGSYVIFGLQGVTLQQNTIVTSGNVGVQNKGNQIQIEQNSQLDSSSIVGDTINLEQNTVVKNIYYNTLNLGQNTHTTTQTTPLSLPVVTSLPAFPSSFTVGSADINVNSGSQTISPGNYNNISGSQGVTLEFTGGTYNINSLSIGQNAILKFDGPSTVYVKSTISGGQNTKLNPSLSATSVLFYVGSSITFGQSSTINANMYAPNDEIHFEQNSIATGAFIGNSIQIEQNSKINLAYGFPTLPQPPTSLSTTAVAGNKITLSWAAPSSNGGSAITGYNIERSTDDVNFLPIIQNTGTSSTTYQDSGLVTGLTYFYEVSAINIVGTSIPSTATSGTTAGDVPSQLSAPTVSPLAGDKVSLSWAAPNSNGYAITGYEIDYSSDGGTIWTQAIVNTDNTTPSYTIPGLTTGTSYEFRVEAINALGTGPAGIASTGTTAGDVPSQVTGLISTTALSTQINLSWAAPSGNGYAISGYELERSTDDVNFLPIVQNTGTSATTYSDSALSSNTLYYYEVSAINQLGTGSPSLASSSTTNPDPPSNAAATLVSSTSVILSWTAPSGTVSGYKIERSLDGTSWPTNPLDADTHSSATTYTDSGLSPTTLYYYRISAINPDGGTSTPSSTVSVTTSPPAPTRLSASATSTTQISLSWTAPSATIRGYEIERSKDGINFSPIIDNTTNTLTSYTDTGLSPNTQYTYSISALGPGGSASALSGTSSATTFSVAPTGLSATAVAGNMISLSWTAPPGIATILGYEIERSLDGTSWPTNPLDADTHSSATTYQDLGLASGNVYYYRVSAINAGDTSVPSSTSTATTAGDVPSHLSAPSVTVVPGGIMILSWSVPADNSYQVSSYDIDYSQNGGSTYSRFAQVTGSPLPTTYTATGLTPGSSYQWRVEAVNALGTSTPGTASTPSTAIPVQIEALTIDGFPVPGATYTINALSGGPPPSNTATDGGTGDGDGISNGIVTISSIPFGVYNITMSTIPRGYDVLGNWTLYTQGPTQLDGTVIFRLVSVHVNASQIGKSVITTPPSLSDTTLSTWQSIFHATKINNTASAIDTVSQLPPILSAGSANTVAINQAVSNQATVQLATTFPPTESSQDIIDTLALPTYSMPTLKNIVSVIPSIVTTNNVQNGQIIATPPLNTIVPGQPMIIPVQSSTIPSTGGVKQIFVQSSSTATSAGSPTPDWFVIRSNQTIPSSLPLLPSSANSKATLFVNVTYPYQETGEGFNWGNPNNFEQEPNMTVTLPKPSAGSNLKTYSDGCMIPAVFLFDSVTHSWTTNQVTILSESPDTGNNNICDYVLQVPHFSQFGFGGQAQSGGHGDYTPGTVPSFVSKLQGTTAGQVGVLETYPLTINDNAYGLDNYSNTGPLTDMAVGTPFTVNLVLAGDDGPLSVKHVSLFTDIWGRYASITGADTAISWDATLPLQVSDPHHFFGPITANATVVGNMLQVTFKGTFANQMPISDIGIRTWGYDQYSRDVYVVNAWESTAGTTGNTYNTNPASTHNASDVMVPPSVQLQVPPIQAGREEDQTLSVQEGPVQPALILAGSGNFTYNGKDYRPFDFKIECQADGYCGSSSIVIDNSTMSVYGYFDPTAEGNPVISLYSQNLQCNVHDLGQVRQVTSHEVVFNCLEPFASGISFDAVLTHR